MKRIKDGRLRSSILLEILAAHGIILAIAVGVSFILQARLAGAALEGQSRELATGKLGLLVEGYRERERELDVALRAIGERLSAGGLTRPGRRNELIAELGRTATSLQMDVLQVVGSGIDPQAATARTIEASQMPIVERTGKSALVRTNGGPLVQAMATPIGTTGVILVGGYDFSDAFAFQMRQKIAGAGQILLVAEGEVVGSTLARMPQGIPGKPKDRETLPTSLTSAPFGNSKALVAYVSIGDSPVPTTSGALGVVLDDPVAALNQALARGRLSSSVFLAVVALGLGWFLFRRIIRPLVGLSATARQIAGGDLNASFTAPRHDEIGRLAQSLERMTSEMQAKTSNLQEASKRLVGAQEQERRRMARDLHDGMQQQLVALAVKLRQASSSPEGETIESLSRLADDAEDAAFALQELGRGISPTVLADQGLHAALRGAASRLPIPVVLNVDKELEEARFSPDIEATIYYVALEAMNNAQKHAAEATLVLELAREGSNLVLKASDDGPGFNIMSARESGGAGLQNMQDRISAEGGSIELASQVGDGTQIVCRIPIPESKSHSTGGGALLEVDENGSHPPVEVGLL